MHLRHVQKFGYQAHKMPTFCDEERGHLFALKLAFQTLEMERLTSYQMYKETVLFSLVGQIYVVYLYISMGLIDLYILLTYFKGG